MTLEKIISLANHKTRIPLLAMIRSLRKTGCQLPVAVIPYSDDRFDLPENCQWWEEPAFFSWLDANTTPGHARSVMRKYQCLLDHSYQFVDSDIIFLRNPEGVLDTVEGFVTCCLHWSNPEHTFTADSRKLLQAKTTLWPAQTFNSGQFACDRRLYSLESLDAAAQNPLHRSTILEERHHEQAGMNLLVHISGIPVTNLTLPPHRMESTWAGDYDTLPHPAWADQTRKPCFIHWAGTKPDGSRNIDSLFFNELDNAETQEWLASSIHRTHRSQWPLGLRHSRRKLRAALDAWKSA